MLTTWSASLTKATKTGKSDKFETPPLPVPEAAVGRHCLHKGRSPAARSTKIVSALRRGRSAPSRAPSFHQQRIPRAITCSSRQTGTRCLCLPAQILNSKGRGSAHQREPAGHPVCWKHEVVFKLNMNMQNIVKTLIARQPAPLRTPAAQGTLSRHARG